MRIPYHATATRPPWSALPAAVRAVVERSLGAPVRGAVPAGGGFTAGFAARVEAQNGRRVFVKAESFERNAVIADCYRREAAVNAALPSGLPAPRLCWSAEVGDWVVLCFEEVSGRMPAWPDDLAVVLRMVDTLASALSPPPAALELSPLSTADLDNWRELAGGSELPGWLSPRRPGELTGGSAGGGELAGQATGGGELPGGLGGWIVGNLDRLAALEADCAVASAGSAMIHGDLRPDNMLLDADGTVWLCDWNWPCLAAPWLDLALMLPTVHDAGIDADPVFNRHAVARDAEPEAVNAVLAAFAGMFLMRGATPAPELASPWLRSHQRYYGAATLSWLRSRLDA